MTRFEFLAKLHEVAPEFTWQRHNGVLRGRYKDCDMACCVMDFCPVTATIRVARNEAYGEIAAYNLALEMGLAGNDAEAIIRAADGDEPDQDMVKLLDDCVGLTT